MSQAFQDCKDDIVDGLFKYIDRMNDYCSVDPADRILDQFTRAMHPLIDEYLQLLYASNHPGQLALEFRSPEEIAEAALARAVRSLRLRPRI